LGQWFLLLGMSQAADVLTTWWGFRAGTHEANPFVAALLAHGDFLAYGAVKAALVLAMILLFRTHGSRVIRRGIQGISIAFCVVALLNAIGIVIASI
jgi:hypothetical protein